MLFGDGREWVCSRASGEVLEIGVGTGRNLPFYSRDLSLTGIDLSPATLEIAQERARALRFEVDLRVGDAQALEFPDGRFDTVVETLALWIPDPRRAVAEAWRVLRPGGPLVTLDHVRSPLPAVRIVQRILDPLSRRFQADNLLREPRKYVTVQGFEILEKERLKWGIVERLVARKPLEG
ncbi:MAG: class I SAM-dependent methyltransferase [Actinomycetota bacterium]